MITLIIIALMNLGLITSAEEYNNLNETQQTELTEGIVIGDTNAI